MEPGVSSRDQFVSRVVANVPLCREHYRLVLLLEEFPSTEPGQFVQVSCRDPGFHYEPEAAGDWSVGGLRGGEHDLGRELDAPLAFLRRPFSLAGRVDRPGGGVELHLIQRVVGVGTDWLGKLREGDTVHLLGPLGNRFTLPPGDGVPLLVGGGVGIPPMLYLAENLAGRHAVVFAGALTRDLLPLTISGEVAPPSPDCVEPLHNVAEFARHGIGAVLTTDDGSYGFRGFVTQALERYLDRAFPDSPSSTQHSALSPSHHLHLRPRADDAAGCRHRHRPRHRMPGGGRAGDGLRDRYLPELLHPRSQARPRRRAPARPRLVLAPRLH